MGLLARKKITMPSHCVEKKFSTFCFTCESEIAYIMEESEGKTGVERI